MFADKECFARFTRHPEWVRAVLETANLIPERGPNRDLFVGDLFDDFLKNIQAMNEDGPDGKKAAVARLLGAASFAADKHSDQRRRDAGAPPT